MHRTAAIALVVAVSLAAGALTACGESPDSTDGTSVTATPAATASQSPGIAGEDPEDGLGQWMTGSWSVGFELVSVKPDTGWARQAADQPSAQWSCRVDGNEMVIDAGLHVYTGTFSEAQGSGDAWIYDGEATWLDEYGVTWTSHIVVEGRRTGDDAFSCTQGGEISSDAEGTLYVAEWRGSGTRVP